MPDVTPALHIDGQIYEGWTSVEVTRDIERMAGAFRLQLTDRWPGNENNRAVKPGFACRLSERSETLVTGWIDSVDVSFDNSDHTISAVGRDKTGDLVDCAAIHAGGEWKNQTVAQIATDLCRPFGITAVAEAPEAHNMVATFKLEEGETAFAAIERLSRLKGLLCTSYTDGRLRLTTSAVATTTSATVKSGPNGNVLSATATFNHAERFSSYTIKGQDNAADFASPDVATAPAGKATDALITRYRPTTILAEDVVDAAACQKRAEWEASVRAGRARRLSVTVQGWYIDGALWRPLTLVDCEIPEVNLTGRMLVSAVTYTLSDAGTTAALTLVDPAAFTGLAQPEAPAESWGW